MTTCCNGYVTGRSTIPCNLAQAMRLPEKEIDPMSVAASIESAGPIATECPGEASLKNSTVATSAAAPPPTPLKSATICGISVILTFRAPKAPAIEPMAMPNPMSP